MLILWILTIIFGIGTVLVKQNIYNHKQQIQKIKKQNQRLNNDNQILAIEHMHLHRFDRLSQAIELLPYVNITSAHFA